MMAATMGFRFACRADRSVLCLKGSGKPTRKACSYCGSPIDVWEGFWGLFVWDRVAQYRPESVIELHVSEARTQKSASASDLVVRWVRKDELHRVPEMAVPPTLWATWSEATTGVDDSTESPVPWTP